MNELHDLDDVAAEFGVDLSEDESARAVDRRRIAELTARLFGGGGRRSPTNGGGKPKPLTRTGRPRQRWSGSCSTPVPTNSAPLSRPSPPTQADRRTDMNEFAGSFEGTTRAVVADLAARLAAVEALEWKPGRWWRVMRGGELWCETSNEGEARASMEPGDVLERLYSRTEEEWRSQPARAAVVADPADTTR